MQVNRVLRDRAFRGIMAGSTRKGDVPLATGVWLRIIRHHRIDQQETEACEKTDAEEALTEMCRRLDLPRPIWLEKNRREWDAFGQTRFLPEAFFESVTFERMEVEFVDTEAPKRRSRDPRNG